MPHSDTGERAITRGELEWPVDRLPAIPSYELSGVVELAPASPASRPATRCSRSRRSTDDGVAADYTALAAELLVARPRALGHAESAAIPLSALTAWQGCSTTAARSSCVANRASASPRCWITSRSARQAVG